MKRDPLPKYQSGWCSMLEYIFSDHEEIDIKLVKSCKCSNNKRFLVQFSSGYIDIIVLFILHFPGSNNFLDTGHDDTGKIIDINCPISE